MLKIGIVGGRGLSTMQGFLARPDVCEVTAICDLDESVFDRPKEKLGYDIPNKFRVYNDMLESDIDAVVIATPMQNHVQQALEALYAGKHVYAEVTAGVTMDELWWLKQAVEETGKTYFFAENYCYIPQNQVIKNMVADGLFGEVYFGEGEYTHNVVSYATYGKNPWGSDTWRRWWQLGKRGCFYPTHAFGPVAQWFKGDHVKSVACFSSGQHVAKLEGKYRLDDTTETLCQMESGKLIKIRVDCMSRRPHCMHYYSLQGTKGCYEAPRGLGDDHKVWFSTPENPREGEWEPLSNYYDKYLPERYKNATEEQKNAGHRGGDFFIVDDFLDAVLKGKQPELTVYDACEWTAIGLLSEISVVNGGRVIEMPKFRPGVPLEEQITKLW